MIRYSLFIDGKHFVIDDIQNVVKLISEYYKISTSIVYEYINSKSDCNFIFPDGTKLLSIQL